jgi:hypothetical protein
VTTLAHPEGAAPTRVRLRVLVPGTRVRVCRPGRGERGLWVVGDRLIGSDLEDPAYELRRERGGRARILRRFRLRPTPTITSSRRR